MDGMHDLGGRHGFGKVDVDEPEQQFHHPYEARMRAIAHAITQAPDWSKDWFRHTRELIPPDQYLTRPYFDQWLQGYCTMLVNSGWASVEELASGKSQNPIADLPPPMTAEQARSKVLRAVRFDGAADAGPMFDIGQTVQTTREVSSGHTRLPVYAREKRGTVISHHGAHVFADDMAVNIKRYVHLYTVEFSMAELWPEHKGSSDTLTLDLWESHLERV